SEPVDSLVIGFCGDIVQPVVVAVVAQVGGVGWALMQIELPVILVKVIEIFPCIVLRWSHVLSRRLSLASQGIIVICVLASTFVPMKRSLHFWLISPWVPSPTATSKTRRSQ